MCRECRATICISVVSWNILEIMKKPCEGYKINFITNAMQLVLSIQFHLINFLNFLIPIIPIVCINQNTEACMQYFQRPCGSLINIWKIKGHEFNTSPWGQLLILWTHFEYSGICEILNVSYMLSWGGSIKLYRIPQQSSLYHYLLLLHFQVWCACKWEGKKNRWVFF